MHGKVTQRRLVRVGRGRKSNGRGVDIVELGLRDPKLDPVISPGLNVDVAVHLLERIGVLVDDPSSIPHVVVSHALRNSDSLSPGEFLIFDVDVLLRQRQEGWQNWWRLVDAPTAILHRRRFVLRWLRRWSRRPRRRLDAILGHHDG